MADNRSSAYGFEAHLIPSTGLFPQIVQPGQIDLPYSDYGYHPNVAQAAQDASLYPNPHLNPQPYFSQEQLRIANWFTTRVHLSPLGKV